MEVGVRVRLTNDSDSRGADRRVVRSEIHGLLSRTSVQLKASLKL